MQKVAGQIPRVNRQDCQSSVKAEESDGFGPTRSIVLGIEAVRMDLPSARIMPDKAYSPLSS